MALDKNHPSCSPEKPEESRNANRDPVMAERLIEALGVAVDYHGISTSMLQRKLKIGYGYACRIIGTLEKLGYVGPQDGTKPREVFVTREEYEEIRKAGEEALFRNGKKTDDSGTGTADGPEDSGRKPYAFPDLELLREPSRGPEPDGNDETEKNKQLIRETLKDFEIGIEGEIEVTRGSAVTRYEFKPSAGTRVSTVTDLRDELSYALATPALRMEAPVFGKSVVGIETPNAHPEKVWLRTLIRDPAFVGHQSPVAACLGRTVEGDPVVFDIARMPHLLIAGAGGTGKSVCLHAILVSLLYRATPDDVRLILIDPKTIEFGAYHDCPLLALPVASDALRTAVALHAACREMERRLDAMRDARVRSIGDYNEKMKDDPEGKPMPRLVIVIDELADLMTEAGDVVENSICRITQMGRACGIHLIASTQRPGAGVFKGWMKIVFPSRIAFRVASRTDSRTILDRPGAEKLSVNGDMLYLPAGAERETRVQGAYVTEFEARAVNDFLIQHNGFPAYDRNLMRYVKLETRRLLVLNNGDPDRDGFPDDSLLVALGVAVENGKISTSLLQRKMKIGYGRACRLIESLGELGYVGPWDGMDSRKVLVTREEYERIRAESRIMAESGKLYRATSAGRKTEDGGPGENGDGRKDPDFAGTREPEDRETGREDGPAGKGRERRCPYCGRILPGGNAYGDPDAPEVSETERESALRSFYERFVEDPQMEAKSEPDRTTDSSPDAPKDPEPDRRSETEKVIDRFVEEAWRTVESFPKRPEPVRCLMLDESGLRPSAEDYHMPSGVRRAILWYRQVYETYHDKGLIRVWAESGTGCCHVLMRSPHKDRPVTGTVECGSREDAERCRFLLYDWLVHRKYGSQDTDLVNLLFQLSYGKARYCHRELRSEDEDPFTEVPEKMESLEERAPFGCGAHVVLSHEDRTDADISSLSGNGWYIQRCYDSPELYPCRMDMILTACPVIVYMPAKEGEGWEYK